MILKRFSVTFLLEGGQEQIIETVEIEAIDKTDAAEGAFKTKICPRYQGSGYRFTLAEVKEI